MFEKDIARNPLFSIIMPVYNVEKYIVDAISSVLMQSCKEFELIIVDDGSTDESAKICDKYAEMDKRIIVIHKNNGGLLSARRVGIKRSTGQYIIHLDSDDMLSEDSLEVLKKRILDTNADLLVYDYAEINNEGEVTICQPTFEMKEGEIPYDMLLHRFLQSVKVNMMWIKCAKREIVDVDDEYKEYGRINMAEDELQSAAIIKNAKKIQYIHRVLYIYRNNASSITHTISEKSVFDSMKAKRRVYDMLIDINAERSFFNDFYKYYIRCLNTYVIKISSQIKTPIEYKEFRKKLDCLEIDIFSNYKPSTIDAVLYKLYKGHNFVAIRILNLVYRIILEKRR